MIQQEFTININDIQLYYRMMGEGPTLLLLHGFFQSGVQYEPLLADLAENFRLIVPDLRGHGRSTNPTQEFTHRQAALDVFALLDALEIKQYNAIGASSGSMILLHMATQQPERMNAMVLFCPTHNFTQQARQIMQAMRIEDTDPEFLDMLHSLHPGGESQIIALFDLFQGLSQSYDDMNLTPAQLSTISARTLIIHGDRDEFFPVSIPVEIYQSIPQATLWIVPNAGHTNLYEAMDACALKSGNLPSLMLGFLKGEP